MSDSDGKERFKHKDILLLGYEDEENLGLRYIAAYLEKNGVSVGLIPIQQMEKEKLLDLISKTSPRIIGFSMIFQRMLPEFEMLITYLRDNAINCHFTMGGHFPTLEYAKTLDLIPGLDTVIRHEGEVTLLELFNHIDNPDHWSEILGLAYRRDGRVQANAPRPLIKNLDSLPFPTRSKHMRDHRGLGISSLITSRGCIYDCSFCSIHQFYGGAPGEKRRFRSPQNVVEEMLELFDKGTRIFIFKDDDFGMVQPAQKEWISLFTDLLQNSGLAEHIIWRISCRIDEVDRKMLLRLKKAGLGFLYLGIESGNNQGLETCNKHYCVEDIYKSLRIIEEVDVAFEYGFMIFDPYSTLNSIRKDIHFLRDLCKSGKAVVHFTKMFPYVGTAIARRLEEEGRLQGPESSPDYRFNDPRVDLLQEFFSKEFYHILFSGFGLVSRLQFAHFEAVIMQRFFRGQIDVDKHMSDLCTATAIFNESILNAMEKVVDFMESRSEKEIMRDWQHLEREADKLLSMQSSLSQAVDKLISESTSTFRMVPIAFPKTV
ncbi:MAG: B12-binding domain-containing radical SAM protein [Methanothrix sp.]